MDKEDREEIIALRDEVRYWKRKAKASFAKANEAFHQAAGIQKPEICVKESETGQYFRVYVNGNYIDGHELSETASRIAKRLRDAMSMDTVKRG